MNKIAAIALVVLFSAVGAIEYEPPTEDQLWAVQCRGYVKTYASPERISLEKEILLCNK
jgi:hypothetical protein